MSAKYFYARIMADTNLYLTQFNGEDFRYGSQVVIASEFGKDLAFINSFLFSKEEKSKTERAKNKTAKDKHQKNQEARFIRYASEEDRLLAAKRLSDSRNIRKEIAAMAADLGLKMNITHVLLPLEGNAMAVYYTADGRVDFRELIKSMKNKFGQRPVMRQIGAKTRLDSFALDARIPGSRHAGNLR